MRKPKHTPGPWNGIEYNSEDLAFDTIRIKNHECESVCITNRANARLIAAAPELLQLIKDIRSVLKTGPLYPGTISLSDDDTTASELIDRLLIVAEGPND
jgi:hypothetical protein